MFFKIAAVVTAMVLFISVGLIIRACAPRPSPDVKPDGPVPPGPDSSSAPGPQDP